jgi:E3 ubiquitin-protein ligase RNF216
MQKHLQQDFPAFSNRYLKESLNSFNGLYAPTHIFLSEKKQRQIVKMPWNIFRTGKHRELHDDEFDKEHEWVLEVMTENDECEDGIECGCCFARIRFVCVVHLLYLPPNFILTAKNDSMF